MTRRIDPKRPTIRRMPIWADAKRPWCLMVDQTATFFRTWADAYEWALLPRIHDPNRKDSPHG